MIDALRNPKGVEKREGREGKIIEREHLEISLFDFSGRGGVGAQIHLPRLNMIDPFRKR